MVRPQFPDYGAFLFWPQEGHAWIHVDDVVRVRELIPSDRVFRREAFDGTFYRLRYGSMVIRLRPCLWQPVQGEGFEIGDQVETVGVGMVRDLFVARITEIRYDRRRQRTHYQLTRADQVVPGRFVADDLRLLSGRTVLRKQWAESRHPGRQ